MTKPSQFIEARNASEPYQNDMAPTIVTQLWLDPLDRTTSVTGRNRWDWPGCIYATRGIDYDREIS